MNSPSSNYLLAVDVGNSRIKFALFDADAGLQRGALPKCLHAAAVSVMAELPWDEIRRWESLTAGGVTTKGIIAGANPAGIDRVLAAWPTEMGRAPVVIEDSTNFPLDIDVDEPNKVGIDRLLNAVAANVLRSENCSVVVVDTGTAITIDYISAGGAFQGGAILPGFELAARSLHEYTALLPLITTEELTVASPNEKSSAGVESLGRNTRDAIRSGIFWGQLGAVRQLIMELGGRSGEQSTEILLILTGGGASLLASHLSDAHLEPHLALQGLVLVAQHCDLTGEQI